jgi:large subunit ribosomal protein L3
MPGHMGSERVTVKNLVVADVRVEQNLILLRGAVPGGKNTVVEIRKEA